MVVNNMIQIDDAGSGSLIGGTLIGIYDTVNDLYYDEIIPLRLYQGNFFNQKLYQGFVIDIVRNGFKELNISSSSDIELCQGYMFDKLRIWLTKNNYNWHNTKIVGPLQSMIETNFNQYALGLGFPYQYIKYIKYPFHFHRILKWVYADYKKRSKLCKTGWKSWQKYGMQDITKETGYINGKTTFHCLKCGKIINSKKKVQILRFSSYKPNLIFLHVSC